MKIKNLLLIVSAFFACTSFNSCICKVAWNDCMPEEWTDCYVKTADLKEGQYVYRDAEGYYVEMQRRLMNDGRFYYYAFPVAMSYRDVQGKAVGTEIVQIPASFAHYLMGEAGSPTPDWMDPQPGYTTSKLTRCGQIVRRPPTSTTRALRQWSDVSGAEKAGNIALYATCGWIADVTYSAIGTGICAVAAPFILCFHPSGLFVMDSKRYNLPDEHRVYTHSLTGGDSATDSAPTPPSKRPASHTPKSNPTVQGKTPPPAPITQGKPKKKTWIPPTSSGH